MTTEWNYPEWMTNPTMRCVYTCLTKIGNAQIEEAGNTIVIHTPCQIGTASFYEYEESGILELSIDRTRTGENKFYLHLQPIDEEDTCQAVHSFLDLLACKSSAVETLEKEIDGCKRVLLVCTSGITSGFFAQLMQKVLDQSGSPARVDAQALGQLDQVCMSCYDKILLTPQVGYQIQDISRRFGAKVSKINPLDFATMNARKVVYEMLA